MVRPRKKSVHNTRFRTRLDRFTKKGIGTRESMSPAGFVAASVGRPFSDGTDGPSENQHEFLAVIGDVMC